jgi:hypothetical protein
MVQAGVRGQLGEAGLIPNSQPTGRITTMTRLTFSTALLAIGLSAVSATAFASDAPDDATQQRIREILTAQGYEVRKIDAEDGLYEAYALKDGQRYEIYMNADLEVVETKMDD